MPPQEAAVAAAEAEQVAGTAAQQAAIDAALAAAREAVAAATPEELEKEAAIVATSPSCVPGLQEMEARRAGLHSSSSSRWGDQLLPAMAAAMACMDLGAVLACTFYQVAWVAMGHLRNACAALPTCICLLLACRLPSSAASLCAMWACCLSGAQSFERTAFTADLCIHCVFVRRPYSRAVSLHDVGMQTLPSQPSADEQQQEERRIQVSDAALRTTKAFCVSVCPCSGAKLCFVHQPISPQAPAQAVKACGIVDGFFAHHPV